MRFEGFFDAAKTGRLTFPRCQSCGERHWYPMKRCPHCRSNDVEWAEVQGRGELYSWTVVRYPFDEKLANALPYIVALVEFADAPGIRFVTNLVDYDEDRLKIGMALDPVFPAPDAVDPVVCFRPADDQVRPDGKN